MKKEDINSNPETSKAQVVRIREHLVLGNTLTPIQALNLFGCFRLGARIHDLKSSRYGLMDIKMKLVKTATDKHVAQYYL